MSTGRADEDPGLDAQAFGRAFPFHLALDASLRVRSAGASLRKALPALQTGDALDRHFDVRRPQQSATIEDWRRHGHQLCTLRARDRESLSLRGAAEFPSDGGLLLLISPVLTSTDALRALGLTMSDFAPHDAFGEMLMLARTTQMSINDTERLAARLQSRSTQLNTILELGQGGVVYFDPAGLLQHANGALLATLGLRREQVDGWRIADLRRRLVELHDPALPPPQLPPGAAADEPPVEALLHLIVPRPAVLRMTSRRADDGGQVYYLRDVTAEFEVDRMKSEFLSTAAHELRTPMASIFGFTELLLNRRMSDERRQDMLQTIHRQTALLIGMVNELLDLARIEARQGKDLNRAPLPIERLVRDSLAPMESVLAAHPVTVALQHPQACIVVDAEKTQQALTNVLSNAAKYSAAGRAIRIDSLDGELDGRPAVGLRVADQGVGMTPEQLGRVFERFYRADPSGNVPGTGLGMCLVKEIVDLQQGRTQVASEPGRGTTVTLWFPLAPAGAAAG